MYVICMYSYVTLICFYAIRISVVYTRMSSVCHLCVLLCHSCVTHVYSYIIHMSHICTRMSSVCHLYILVCNPYVTCIHLYVICMLLVYGFTKNQFQWQEIQGCYECFLILFLLKCYILNNFSWSLYKLIAEPVLECHLIIICRSTYWCIL